MNIWKIMPFATVMMAVPLQAQFTSEPQGFQLVSSTSIDPSIPTSVPLYRVTVVQGSAKAINYRDLRSSTKIDLKGTVLLPNASGVAKIKSDDGVIQIVAKVEDLPPASTFGWEYLTYVLWGISTEGRATNLGEIVLKHGKGKVEVTEKLQTFGLVVTAEPYYAVSQPSDAVVMENSVGKDKKNQFEFIDAKYELLKRGQYTVNLASTEPMLMDEKTPFVVYQARNALRIAQAAGASTYAPEPFEKAQGYLRQTEAISGDKKERVMMAKEAIQRAEDSRLIAIQRQKAEQVAMDQKLTQDKINTANNEATLAAAAQAAAIVAKDSAVVAKDAALVAKETAQVGQQAAMKETRQAEAESLGLRAKLKEQLDGILQTRATARGLVMNMSGVLFQNGKATLLPAAREKLAKIAGILLNYNGLKIEAEGFTDSNGSEAFNLRLSEQRASNAKAFLVSQGLLADSILSKGFGKENPIATNDTNAGRQENRRVELVVSGLGLAEK